jgi:hypothetical protein
VSLHRDGSVRHGAGDEALDDLVPRFDLLERDLVRVLVVEVEETTEGDGANLTTSVLGVGVVGGLVLLANGVLELSDAGGVVDVSLSSVAPVVFSSLGETGNDDGVAGGVAALVQLEGVDGEELKVGSSDSARGSCSGKEVRSR